MTDEEHEATSDDAELAKALTPEHGDVFLRHLVAIANAYGVGFSLTLVVQGAIVHGGLISARRWFEGAAELMRSATPSAESPEGAEVFVDLIAGWFTQFSEGVYGPTPATFDDIELKGIETIGFIHLENARISVAGVGAMVPVGGLWRGRIGDVSGWSVGGLDAVAT